MTTLTVRSSIRSRWFSLALVVGALVVFVLFSEFMPEAWAKWQSEHLHWNYIPQALFYLLPLALIVIGLRSWREYALVAGRWRRDVLLGSLIAAILFFLPTITLAMGPGLVFGPVFQAFTISTLIFLFYSGFAEEAFYRGFSQHELDRATAKPFRIGATRFGFGVLLIALTFGLGHGISPGDLANPTVFLDPDYEFRWGHAAFAGGFAFFAGLLRERTGSILAPGLIHAGWNAPLHMWAQTANSLAAHSLAAAIAGLIVSVWLLVPDRATLSDGRITTTHPAPSAPGRPGCG